MRGPPCRALSPSRPAPRISLTTLPTDIACRRYWRRSPLRGTSGTWASCWVTGPRPPGCVAFACCRPPASSHARVRAWHISPPGLHLTRTQAPCRPPFLGTSPGRWPRRTKYRVAAVSPGALGFTRPCAQRNVKDDALQWTTGPGDHCLPARPMSAAQIRNSPGVALRLRPHEKRAAQILGGARRRATGGGDQRRRFVPSLAVPFARIAGGIHAT
jgi:hypothetical protein